MTSPPLRTTELHQLRGALLATAVVGLSSACSSPDELPLPGVTDLPPKPAALACSQMGGYAQNFGNDTFFVADLDRGVNCEQFFEQDQCIIAVFQDCSFSIDNERERHWTGIASLMGEDRHLRMEAGYTGDSLPARLPSCCEGTLLPGSPADADWSLMECRTSGCAATDDVSHAGYYIERLIDFDPASRLSGTPETLASDLIASETDSANPSTFWLLLQDSLQLRDTTSGNMVSSYPINDTPLSLSVGSQGAFVGGQQRWFFVNSAGVLQEAPAGGAFIEVLVTSSGLLALRDNLGTRELLLIDPNTSAVVATSSAAGISDLIGWQEPGYIAAALLNGDQLVQIKTDLSSEAKLGLWQSVPNQRSLLDFTGDLVAASTPLVAVGPQRAAFSAPCHADSDVACWFEFGGSQPPTRVGLGVGGVNRAWVVPGGDFIAFGTNAGRLMALERNPLRPRLQEVLQFSGSIMHVSGGMGAGCARAWVNLAGERTVIPAHLEDCSQQ